MRPYATWSKGYEEGFVGNRFTGFWFRWWLPSYLSSRDRMSKECEAAFLERERRTKRTLVLPVYYVRPESFVRMPITPSGHGCRH